MNSWTAISRSEHADARWRPRDGFQFAAKRQVIEVFVNELSVLLPHYTFCFTKEAENFQFVALVGLGGERNLYVNAELKWLCKHVPATLRTYPFKLANNSETGERVLCIDENHLTDDADAAPLFDADGNLAPATAEMVKLLKHCDRNRKRTQAAVGELAAAGAIEAWP